MSNSVTVIGRLTQEPDPIGDTGVKFSVAHNRGWTDKSGERQEETSFFNVVAWGYSAEGVKANLTKGDKVVVVGHLKQESWENDAGERRSAIVILATDVGLVVAPPKRSN